MPPERVAFWFVSEALKISLSPIIILHVEATSRRHCVGVGIAVWVSASSTPLRLSLHHLIRVTLLRVMRGLNHPNTKFAEALFAELSKVAT